MSRRGNWRAAKRVAPQPVEKVVEAFFEERRPTSLIQSFAETEEVANMVVYVASPLSAATNGAALRVDGGVANYII